MNSAATMTIPLCVDLDGTLIRTDLLLESTLSLLKQNPLYLFVLPFWLLGGRANLKRRIAQRTRVDIATLPWDVRVIELLETERERRPLVLCTASDYLLADAVARHLGCFDQVMASDGSRNLSGRHKADLLVEAYGERGFDYAGNEKRDLAIWKHARQAVVVNASSRLAGRVSRVSKLGAVLPREHVGVRTWLKAMRLHQWAKNVLVFLPLLASHRVFDPDALWRTIATWLIFGLCASGVYVLNDLFDLGADRVHPRKRLRPFAAGTLRPTAGLATNLILTVIAFAGAVAVSWQLALVLLGYWLLTNAYSLKLKRVVVLDVIVLAGLYTVRILGGAAATHIAPSFWMLAFSMFLFLSLAMLKRYAELIDKKQDGVLLAAGRGYHVDDLSMLASLGTASGLLSVLVFSLYIQGEDSVRMYQHPALLWILCPLQLYWISRVWFVAHRGAMHDDPVIFAIADWTSRIVIVLCAIVVVLAV